MCRVSYRYENIIADCLLALLISIGIRSKNRFKIEKTMAFCSVIASVVAFSKSRTCYHGLHCNERQNATLVLG